MGIYGEYDEAMYVARMMMKHGGGFVHHLGQALIRADVNNTARIKEAFPEYWQTYNDIQEAEAARRSKEAHIDSMSDEEWDTYMRKSAQVAAGQQEEITEAM